MLTAIINEYKVAAAVFQKACDLSLPDTETDPLFRAEEAAVLDVLRAPCLSLDDVRAKARLALADENVFDSLTNCMYDSEHGLSIFLKSLIGESQEAGQ